MPMTMRRPMAQPATRQALLEAAGAVFAERGYRNTTVRQICRQAGANVAAVNYHFGGKEPLYLEVLRSAHGRAAAQYPYDLEVRPGDPPADRLRAFIRSLLLRVLDPGPTAWLGKLIAMEMINPSVALDSLVQERIRPMAEALGRIVAEVLGRAASPERVRLCGFSIVSQCLFYAHCRPVLVKLYPDQRFELLNVERLAEHIARFSLAALQPAPRPAAGRRRPPLATPRPPQRAARARS
jgi:TetR/AcrR family transcriptional regulator, regulator of cefoperazone and chloramphenicol sensitivity